jgi:arylsulfatase A-like enzyme
MSKPNFLFIMVDEMRYPPQYENEEIEQWRKKYLKAQNELHSEGINFKNHYTMSTACAPSRTSIFCGQYPSLHGVSQTDGAAKTAFDSDMFWLDPNTVPNIGNYFSTAGYTTFYKGKWHISHGDIVIPDTYNPYLSYDPNNGIPNKEATSIYKKSGRLENYQWHNWIGPEPHGTNPRNSGSSATNGLSGRDVIYAQEVIKLIEDLEKINEENPWFIVASLVNPHDITLFGEVSKFLPNYNFAIDPSVPYIPPAPTAHEDLSTKPTCQENYKLKYNLGFQPTIDSEFYRKLYYSLTLYADQNVEKILHALKKSKFADNTIIIFTSDHGDYLGAHGLYQKWYTAYEEAIHVPLIIKIPASIRTTVPRSVDALTSHVDILPTLLGLAGISQKEIQKKLKKSHIEVHSLVGRDLTPLIYEDIYKKNKFNEPLYFMTDDDVLMGQNQYTLTGQPYKAVIQPNHVETVIVTLSSNISKRMNSDEHVSDKTLEKKQIWKYSHYFDNPQFWTNPGKSNNTIIFEKDENLDKLNVNNLDLALDINLSNITTRPVPSQYEMYNITEDPYETKNLANPKYATTETKIIEKILNLTLSIERQQKRLYPTNGTVKGKPTFSPADERILPRPS